MKSNYLVQIEKKKQEKSLEEASKARTQAIIDAIKSSNGETKDSVISAIHDVLVAQKISKDPRLLEVSKDLTKLLKGISEASNKVSSFSSIDDLTRALHSLPQKLSTDRSTEIIPHIKELTRAVKMSKPPEVHVDPVDLKPLKSLLERLEKSIQKSRIEAPPTDFSQVEEAVDRVNRTIKSLKLPVPNYVMPFRDIQGRASQVQLDAEGRVPVSGVADSDPTYAEPAFSSFVMSGQATSVEVGTTLSGDKTFTWATTNPENVTPNSVVISDGGTILDSGLDSSGSTIATITSTQLTSPGTHSWTITGTNTQSDSFTRNFTVSWLWKVYYGTSTNVTLTEAQIEALVGNQLASSGLTTYSLAAGGYKYICYPASLPGASLFTDTQTGFDVTMATVADNAAYSNTENGYSYALVSVTNAQSQTTNYRVYRTRFQLGSSIDIRVV